MARKGDPTKQPPECKPVFTPIPNHPQGLGHWSKCPNLKEVGGGMDGERVEARAIANERRRRSGS